MKLTQALAALSVLALSASGAAAQGKSGKAHDNRGHQGPVVAHDGWDGHKGAVRGAGVACPPGLAKKGNGCMPPGQARKYGLGDRLPSYLGSYNLPTRFRGRYRDNRAWLYRYEGDTIYRVNRRTGRVDNVISALVR
jgi:hypothetical protein